MIQALRYGFRYSTISSFPSLRYMCPNSAAPAPFNLKMAPKRRLSNSSVSNVEKCRGDGLPKTLKNAQKASTRKIGVVEDESEETQVVGKSSFKGKGLSEIGGIKNANNELGDARGKRTKKAVNQPSEYSIQNDSLLSTSEKELIIQSSEIEGENLVRGPVNKKATSRVAASSTKVSVGAGPSGGEPWTILTHKKPQQGWVAYDPKTMRPPALDADAPHMKIMSWNVNGLRALLKSESFSALQLARRENFDVLCLQETKLQEKDVDAIRDSLLEGYDNSYWTCSVSKLGYSGTAIISRIKPRSVRYGLGISDHDSEGRLVTVEFDNFYLLCSYVPNSGDGLKRLSYRITEWDPSLSDYMKDLEKSKPVILTGDLNCAHQEIDIFNPAGNKRSAGFTDEERDSFQKNFLDRGFVDTFRKQHHNVVGYTYWGYRHGGRKTNKGWRLDYFLASESIADRVHDSYILPDVAGSDHCPLGLTLKL